MMIKTLTLLQKALCFYINFFIRCREKLSIQEAKLIMKRDVLEFGTKYSGDYDYILVKRSYGIYFEPIDNDPNKTMIVPFQLCDNWKEFLYEGK